MKAREVRQWVSRRSDAMQFITHQGPLFIRRLRDQGLTHQNIAMEIGSSTTFVNNVQQGWAKMPPDMFAKLYDKYGGHWVDC